MNRHWHEGNRVRLLENGDEFFPRVLAAIRDATQEVFLETFIFGDDKIGQQLRAALIDASERGVHVSVLVDGFGSYGFDGEFSASMTAAGVHVHIFDPGSTLLGLRTNLFRRMHRKLVVIDSRIAFIGGINFCADHLSDFGPEAKQDYAAEIAGPAALEMRDFCERAVKKPGESWTARVYRRHLQRRRRRGEMAGKHATDTAADCCARVMFITRDNHLQRTQIEFYYRLAMRTAQRELIIANAYFFPGYRLLRSLRSAARRNVDVKLILQGRPDIGLVKWAAALLYEYLLSGGVQIYEYCERPFHGKVAIMDDSWATIGSSNLDPLSLALNLEANAIIADAAFNRELRAKLNQLMTSTCRRVQLDRMPRHTWWRGMVSAAAFHLLRMLPVWAELLPRQTVKLKKI